MNLNSKFSETFLNLSANALVSQFKTGQLSIARYLEDLFSYITALNPTYNAMTSLQFEDALKRAKTLETKGCSEKEFLFGVPVVIKENIQKIKYSVQCGSKMLAGYKGQYDATVVTLLEEAGAIIIGTGNMDEFAMGSANEHSCHGPVKNPFDITRVSGGSSGGPAVACAAGFAPLTLGSDTGGSVRLPAAFCGIYGFKPSYGMVSRFGLVAYGSSLDQVAPFARTADDIDIVMRAIGKEDEKDPTTLPGQYQSLLNTFDLKGKKVGVPRKLFSKGVDAPVLEALAHLESELKGRGVEFVDVELNGVEHSLAAYYIIACAEASSNLARFDGIRYGHRTQSSGQLSDLYCKTRSEGFGAEVKRRIMLGTFALSEGYYDSFYGKAQSIRAWIAREFENQFKNVDFIYLPTSPSPAFSLGSASDPLKEYLYDVFTIPANLGKICGMSAPAFVASGSLPIGLQFLAARGQDAKLVAFVNELEKEKLIGKTPLC